MRKRNVSFLFDKCLWFLILILPLIFALSFTFSSMNNYKLDVNGITLDGYDYVFSNIDEYNLSINMNGSNNFISTIYTGQEIFNDYSYLVLYINNDYFELYYDDTSNQLLDYENDYPFFDYVSLIDIEDIIYAKFTINPYVFYFLENYYGSVNVTFIFSSYDYVTTLPFDIYSYVLTDFILPSYDNIFGTYFNNLNYCLDSWMNYSNSDLVYTAFNDVFGTNGILPIFTTSSFLPKYLTYMSWVFVLHLVFDFLVFIPRLAHKWMGDIYRDGDD